MQRLRSFEYDLALSFAGEDRDIAEYVANKVKSAGYKVFYDSFEKVELWGSDLSRELPKKYRNSRFCLVLLTEVYLGKMWTTLERQAIISEFLKNRGENYLLPVFLNGFSGDVPGLSDLTAYLSINSTTEKDSLADKVLRFLKTKL
jgi:hypothetical protein